MQALIVAAAALGGLGVYLMMPRGAVINRNTGMAISAAALVLLWVIWLLSFQNVEVGRGLLFCLLASMTVTGGVMTVTRTSPVSCALWFTTVVIGTAGLFLLQNAQFLAAAIVIVYAGAIIVMFLFVIMMAQQSGTALYDRLAREPGLAVLASFVLLIALVSATVSTYRGESPALTPTPGGAGVTNTALLDDAPDSPQVAKLGATLFAEHWVSLEVAGTMLLVAMVGTIVIAARRERA
jgi:NADH-quinone oxidoreductase subunit J